MLAPLIQYKAPRARKRPQKRRRNPLDAAALATLLQQHGRGRAAELLKKYPDMVAGQLPAIEARLKARGFFNAPLADADAWAELAWLAPKALAGEDAALIAAVQTELSRR